jgi:hypothetical protein
MRLLTLLAAEAAKTKSVGGKEYPASDFLYVGDPDETDTWSILVADAAHVRDGMARWDQDKVIPDSKKKAMAKKLARIAKKMDIDPSGFVKKYVTAEADLSLDQQQALLNGALREQFGLDEQGCQRFWLFEAFDDYLIARGPDGKLFRIPYEIDGDDVDLEDAQEVTTAYVPVAEAGLFLSNEADAAPVSGRYPIVVLKAGWGTGAVDGTREPHYYPQEFVAQVAEAVAGKPFGRRHPDLRSPDPTGATQPERIAGWLEGGQMVGDEARSTVRLFSSESELRSKLDEMYASNKRDLWAVSMLGAFGFVSGVVEGKRCLIAESLDPKLLFSVDLCQRAGAGGRFLTAAASLAGDDIAARQLAAVNPQSTAIQRVSARRSNSGGAEGAGEATMKKKLQKLLEALRGKNPARAAELTMKFALATEAEIDPLFDEVTTALTEAPPASATALTAEAAATILADAKRLQSRNRIEAKLTDSKLPEAAKKLARTHLETALTAEADLPEATIDAEIVAVREAFAAFNNVGTVRAISGVVLDSRDKLQLAMEAAFGVKESMNKGVPAFTSLRRAYATITGDDDLSRLSGGGGFCGHMLASEAVLTGDFPNILLNSMTKRLLQDWAELTIDGLQNLYTKATISDYKLQDRVREGYFGELPTVAEGNPYQEIAYPTDELVTYQVAKRGRLLTITEETIRNDDLGAIARFPGRLARAARMTLRKYVTNFYLTNPNYTGDGVAWFNAGHNNLYSAALTNTALIAARTGLRLQTEKDSGEPLGFNLNWIMVPAALESTAIAINQTNTAGSNQFYQAFGANNERIYVNEMLDATDNQSWYFGTDQRNAPFFELGFLDGIEQPQIFLANQPTIGTQFTADELQYKVKHVYNGAIIDFRGVGKSLV